MATRVSVTTTVSPPPAEVFAFLADPANDPLWCDAVKRTEYEGGAPPGAVGARYRFVEGFSERNGSEGHIEITELDPPRRMVSVATTADRRYVITYDVAPDGHGSRVTQATDAEFIGPAGRFSALFRPMITWQYRRQFRSLRRHLG